MDIIMYKVALVWLVAHSCAQTFPRDSGCIHEENYQLQECIYTYYCTNSISGMENTQSCDYRLQHASSGYDLVNIILKPDSESVNDFELPRYYDDDILPLIHSLDLRDTILESVPTIRKMDSLESLILSKNALITAKLSNRNELPALIDLDFSQNAVNNIEIMPGEYQYTKLKKFDISHNYLVNIPEAIFDSFSDLQTLDLSHNYIYSLGVLTFEGIRKLLHLYLSNNRITDINSCLLRFNDLVTLDLSHNNIQTLKRIDFNNLVNLKFLYLNSNDIYFAEANVFDGMVSLTTIDLSSNNIASIDQGILTNATELKFVSFSHNKFKSLAKYMFKGKSILNFTIAGNELEGNLEKGSFEGLTGVPMLDLSGQHLSCVNDYAFAGVQNLKTLLLNNNDLQMLSRNSLKGLLNLNVLDLSHNNLTTIEFTTEDLINLQMLSLHQNQITVISSNNFVAMSSLQILDLSYNNISCLESNSFKSLLSLSSFKISDNPLSGPIEEGTFDGLNLLPTLDISGSLVNRISNYSFTGMSHLIELNISHSIIEVIEFNSLCFLTNIQVIDLSHNRLCTFEVNTTDLVDVRTVILNNNFLRVITHSSFNGMGFLSKIILSHNRISNISKEAFYATNDLRYLDLSYNSELEFDVSLIKQGLNLISLLISGIKSNVNFETITDIPLSVLKISHAGIENVTLLHLNGLSRLETLVLSNNAVCKLEVSALSNLTALNQLDLSFNNLSFIQPGAFKDNNYLHTLNISHNNLIDINYGIFNGLMFLVTMDLSYNSIQSLHQGRFYGVDRLTTLIADHNRIDFISPEEFSGIHLSTLSIGGNPLPCDILVGIKTGRTAAVFEITAIELDKTHENVGGVTCNRNSDDVRTKPTLTHDTSDKRDKLLLDIKDILYNMSREQKEKDQVLTVHNDIPYLANFTDQIEKLSSVNNFTSLVNLNNKTNWLLEKMLSALILEDSVTTTKTTRTTTTSTTKPVTFVKENTTSENLVPYINKIKHDLDETIKELQETKAKENQNIVAEFNNKFEKLNSRFDSLVTTTKMPVHDKLIVGNDVGQKSSMFTEISVGLILAILVGYILVKLYKSKLYIPSNRSLNASTRHIVNAMENSHL